MNSQHKNTFFSSKRTLNCGGTLLSLERPLVMGILNFTPDSFYDGAKHKNTNDVLKHVSQMLEEGADIIDIGAVSTKPGAKEITTDDEKNKLIPILKIIKKDFPNTIISIDTYRSEIAKAAVDFGAHIINDISAGTFDKEMFKTISKIQVPYIIMHIQGTPLNMQENPVYNNVVKEVVFYLSVKVEELKRLGVNDIIIDPGFGFGKTVEHNYELLNNLEYFRIFELPLLVGFSRKSMINKVLNTTPSEALNGTTVLNTIALMNGANILRVHDVKEAVESVKIVEKLNLLK
ncbi:MAG: dihydropteroate synthase [Bacteroidales bacterium]|jgi:dihydropteroate synthase